MALLACVFLTNISTAQISDVCSNKLLPLFFGGASDEFVNCLIYDPKT
jgi:hypothetical protein